MKLKIDPDLAGLMSHLTPEESAALEQSILTEGCREAIIHWGGVIVDGHNRHRICTKHRLPFRTVEKVFRSKTDAQIWMVQNQLGRRNLSAYQKCLLALKLEPVIAAQARSNQRRGVSLGSVKGLDTQRELARIAVDLRPRPDGRGAKPAQQSGGTLDLPRLLGVG